MSKAKTFPKIEFDDKIDSWSLGKGSPYVLSAKDVNEIKSVVNSLSQKLEDSVTFADLYAELRLKLPGTVTPRKPV